MSEDDGQFGLMPATRDTPLESQNSWLVSGIDLNSPSVDKYFRCNCTPVLCWRAEVLSLNIQLDRLVSPLLLPPVECNRRGRRSLWLWRTYIPFRLFLCLCFWPAHHRLMLQMQHQQPQQQQQQQQQQRWQEHLRQHQTLLHQNLRHQ